MYVVLGTGAALENIFPPVPADTFVLLGAFLAGLGRAEVLTVFFVTWGANVASALGVYGLARRYGRRIFESPKGRWLLRPRQIAEISDFYDRWGVPAIFLSRFLPAFRALVPVFAGVSRLSLSRIAFPLAIASALWYGALIYLGAFAGRNWGTIREQFADVSSGLSIAAGVLVVLLVAWWWRSRHVQEEQGGGGGRTP